MCIASEAQHACKEKGCAKGRRPSQTLAIQRHQTRDRLHQLRKRSQPPPPLRIRYQGTGDIQRLKIPQTSMNRSKAVEAGAAPEIVALQQHDALTAGRTLECEQRAIDAPTDDRRIENRSLQAGVKRRASGTGIRYHIQRSCQA